MRTTTRTSTPSEPMAVEVLRHVLVDGDTVLELHVGAGDDHEWHVIGKALPPAVACQVRTSDLVGATFSEARRAILRRIALTDPAEVHKRITDLAARVTRDTEQVLWRCDPETRSALLACRTAVMGKRSMPYQLDQVAGFLDRYLDRKDTIDRRLAAMRAAEKAAKAAKVTRQRRF